MLSIFGFAKKEKWNAGYLGRLGNSMWIYCLNISIYHTMEFHKNENSIPNNFSKFYNNCLCSVIQLILRCAFRILQSYTALWWFCIRRANSSNSFSSCEQAVRWVSIDVEHPAQLGYVVSLVWSRWGMSVEHGRGRNGPGP